METLFYAIIAGMLSVYVILDGFDLGAGILHLLVAKSDPERRQVLASIGPFWNGNEVWLIAAGGMLVFAFPRVYATGFSGFYLPLMMVLWLLIGRGLSIEFRSKEENPLWRSFWDVIFFLSSTLMAIVLGAALGNVIRGVPIGANGYFDGALFTNFMPGKYPGVLDWYTVAVGIFATVTLAGHGALFLVWKTSGAVSARASQLATKLWPSIAIFGIVVTALTHIVRPELYRALVHRPGTWPLALGVGLGLVWVFKAMTKKQERRAFFASSLFILSLLSATAAGMYPNMLISTVDPAYTLTADNAAIGKIGLSIGLMWWIPTIILAAFYFANLFRTFAGKSDAMQDSYGH